MQYKLNCWEYKKCGREPGGAKVKELGVCPATTDAKLHGVHGGENAGRACWVVAGSMCGGKMQGTFAQKYGDCVKCDFFKDVKEKEGANYIDSSTLLGNRQEDNQSRLNFFKQSHSHVPDKTQYKEAAVIETIKKRTNLLTWTVLLIIFTLMIVNTNVIFKVLNFIPSFSVIILLFIASGLVLIGFYLSRRTSLNAINDLMKYSNEINTHLIAKEQEITKRKVAEENLQRANEGLENRVKERTAKLSKTVKILKENVAKRKNMEEQLYNLSITDELTGLYNRRGFFTLAEHRLKLAKRQTIGLLLLYADLDNLKEINDTFGHEEGDKLLRETGNILKSTYRNSDIVARIGGDEFVVFPVGTTEDHIEILTSRLQKNIEIYNAKSNSSYKLSISIGVSAYYPKSVTTIDGLLAEADKLMYKHKMCKESLD
jgi:diguanylate cyclase (GGDEF)-like protein